MYEKLDNGGIRLLTSPEPTGAAGHYLPYVEMQ